MKLIRRFILPTFLSALSGLACAADDPQSMLRLPGSDGDPAQIDYTKLPVLKGTHTVVCPYDEQWKFQLHNYLLHHDGKYWCMWSHGPVVEDEPTQHVRYATSDDGLKWSESKMLTGAPAEGRAYIARGFWVRDGELLALAAYYKGKGAFGVDKDLRLEAFAWDKETNSWKHKGLIFDNSINNFAPQKLSTGEWMITRRDPRFNVSMLIGGVKALDDWRVVPVVDRLTTARTTGFSPDEPVWWEQPDTSIVALFRDNGGSNRLFRASSTDHGQTWSAPVKTDYPNSPSKLFTLRTSGGCRVLISNANPTVGRREMYLAVSEDGLIFTRMARLEIPSARATTFQYPHAIEHDGHLLIAVSNKKNLTELIKLPLAEVERLRQSAR